MNEFVKNILDVVKDKMMALIGTLIAHRRKKTTEVNADTTTPAAPTAADTVETKKNFSDLVQNQFDYLINKLDEYQKGYYEISDHTFALLDQMSALKAELITAKLSQCTVSNCKNRKAEE